MSLPRRRFSRELKLHILAQIEAGQSVAVVAREHQIHPTLITKWRQQLAKYADKAFSGNGRPYQQEARVAELERMVGQLTMENVLLKKALTRLESRSRPTRPDGSK
ncbi:transposase [Gloeobacter morelensis]|uniref:Transposase n=1 Tax=Gloeobacter morelensis MG652769 TaxID=2781736 RepID=A0ABY3PH30_9CYAN|nr:transposase [Gloeobacter morelensis]UFP92981.1 transposase [Gloeobacter morelensis MG652769]